MKLTTLYSIAFLFLMMSCSTQKIYQSDSDRVVVEDPATIVVDDASQIDVEEPTEAIEKDEVYEAPEEEYTEERTLDELVVTAPRNYQLPRYNPAEPRDWDLKHMDLDVRFDWINEHVLGRAELLLTPYFYEQNQLILDAKGFEIIDIASESGRTYNYQYNNAEIAIDLGKIFQKDEELKITIDYVAKPSEGPEGGSAAITSDKGLFFINPREETAGKPRQIWTQGETQNNSRWFPTLDQPNENMTHDIHITVEDQFKTLSNGTLVSSKNYINNTRTDHWKMDLPHAPYLTMIAVGDFALVQEEVDGILLEYYVEPEYAPYAKQIFAHTPEMIRFFSDILDYPYPWNKFSQIITRDYVSGAMENTTAVIYGEFIQKTDRELIDNPNDYIVAHELFHHWFGDLVTCESWANLTLQEGFANYSEHLWQEYKYGSDAAGFQRNNEKQGYLGSIMQSGTHPLIHYGYEDKEQMFDGHSYNKGGLVLHMLRHQIGDEAFYAGLNRYLTTHKYTAVEVDELRMAFEDVSGLDLHWFFDQWYHEAGHPILELAYDYNIENKSITITVDQDQDTESSIPIFILPVTVSVFDNDGKETQFEIIIDERNDVIEIPYEKDPALIVFDRFDHLLFIKRESKTTEEYINQYNWVDTYIHRLEAIDKVKNKKTGRETIASALDDGHFSIRKIAVDNVRLRDRPDLVDKLMSMAKEDAHSAVRGAAIKKLNSVSDLELTPLLQDVLSNEPSYAVIGSALETLNRIDSQAALKEAVNLKSESTAQLVGSVSRILSSTGDATHIPYFEEKLTTVDLFSVFNFYNSYYEILKDQNASLIQEKAVGLKMVATDMSVNMFYRFAATNTLSQLSKDLSSLSPEIAQSLKKMILDIKAVETNEMLKARYGAF